VQQDRRKGGEAARRVKEVALTTYVYHPNTIQEMVRERGGKLRRDQPSKNQREGKKRDNDDRESGQIKSKESSMAAGEEVMSGRGTKRR